MPHTRVQGKGRRPPGQTVLEYALLIGVIVSLLVAMTPLVRRGVQGIVKLTADQLGNQKEADQKGGDAGYLVSSYTTVRSDIQKRRQEKLNAVSYSYPKYEVSSETFSTSNLGFREEFKLNMAAVAPFL